MELKRVASYLAGNFPPYYQASFDKSIFIAEIRAISNGAIKKDDTDEMREYAKNDEELFYMWLNRLSKIDETLLHELFPKLGIIVPLDVLNINWGLVWRPKGKPDFETLIKQFKEIPATEEIIWPILSNFFEIVWPRWHKIKHWEWGHDLHIIAYNAPFWVRYIGIQVKKWDIWEKDIIGDDKIFNQLETAMSVAKVSTDGLEVKPHEMMLITTGKMHEEPRSKLIAHWNTKFPNSRLVIWDMEELYQQILKYWLPQEPLPR